MTDKQNTIKKIKLLIVEGNHERDFFEAWVERNRITDIQVMPIGGKTLIAESLRNLGKQRDFPTVRSLVIIRDADDDPTGAFQSVCSALQGANLPIPNEFEQFITQDALKVAVVITPGNNRKGALEELLLETVVADPLLPAAVTYIDSAVSRLNDDGIRSAPPHHKQGKAKIHAFLATFEEPDKDPGKAALAGVWNFNHPALDPIRTVLSQM
jgi:hypothetical protein